jgi:hypothetical protein
VGERSSVCSLALILIHESFEFATHLSVNSLLLYSHLGPGYFCVKMGGIKMPLSRIELR